MLHHGWRLECNGKLAYRLATLNFLSRLPTWKQHLVYVLDLRISSKPSTLQRDLCDQWVPRTGHELQSSINVPSPVLLGTWASSNYSFKKQLLLWSRQHLETHSLCRDSPGIQWLWHVCEQFRVFKFSSCLQLRCFSCPLDFATLPCS